MEDAFYKGTRVRSVKPFGFVDVGSTGTVIEEGRATVGVEFDKCVKGHDCGGLCEPGYGWYVMKAHLELIDDTDNAIAVPDDGSIANLLCI